MKALEITDLRKRYGDKTAVDGISFSVDEGEFFGFLGPNGAGKTTTIGCTTGTVRITSGTIRVFGLDVEKDYREARRLVGIAPQEFNVEIFTPVEQMLTFVAGFYGLNAAARKRRVSEVIERFELGEHKEKAFRALSGGLKRRAMLARAMVHDPKLIILDEPTAGVDVELRHELWRHLKELNAAGKTILLTSHYLEEVEMLCQRIGIVNRGKIAMIGQKEEFVNDGNTLEQRYLQITKGESW